MAAGIVAPHLSHVSCIFIPYGKAIHIGNVWVGVIINIVATLVGSAHAVVVTEIISVTIVAMDSADVVAQFVTKSIGAFYIINIVIAVYIAPTSGLIFKPVFPQHVTGDHIGREFFNVFTKPIF